MKIRHSNSLPSISRVLAWGYWELAKILSLIFLLSDLRPWKHMREVLITTQSTPDVLLPSVEHPTCSSLLAADGCFQRVCWIPYKALRLCWDCVVPFPIMVRKGKSLCPEPSLPDALLQSCTAVLPMGEPRQLQPSLDTALRLRHGSSCTPQSTHSHSTAIKKKKIQTPLCLS